MRACSRTSSTFLLAGCEAVNLATDEAERTSPPSPLFPPPIGGDPTEWPIESPKPKVAKSPPEPVVCNMALGERGYLPSDEEPRRRTFLRAAAPIRLQIYRDMLRQPEELHSLLWIVAMHLGDRGLTAAFARRMMQYKDPKVLRRFRREVGRSLTEYIQRRQRQLAAKMYHRSGLPRGDIAERLGFPGGEAMTRTVEQSAGRSLAELRDRWEDRGIDHVVWERVRSGEAKQDDLEQQHYESHRLRVSLELLEGVPVLAGR